MSSPRNALDNQIPWESLTPDVQNRIMEADDVDAAIAANRAAMTTDDVPEGATNLYFTMSRASAAAPVQSVNGRTGAVTLTKADVGLSNLDNTADLSKPISTATQTALNGKANTSHTHSESDITGLVSDLSALSSAIAGKAALSHTHVESDITGLVADLAGKAALSHTHPQSDITGLVTALAGKEPVITAGTTGQYWRGDKSWQTLPVAPVSSVAGRTGAITLAEADIANLVTDLAGKAASVHTHVIADVTGLQTALDGKLNQPVTPLTITPTFGTAYQATTNTKAALISVMIETTYTITIAGTQTDTVELRIGPVQATVANGTAGTGIASFRSSLTGIALTVGLAQAQRSQLSAIIPAGWWYAVRRVAGTTATIQGAFEQPL